MQDSSVYSTAMAAVTFKFIHVRVSDRSPNAPRGGAVTGWTRDSRFESVCPVSDYAAHSRTSPASGPTHANVVTRRKVPEKDPRLPVAHAMPRHSH